MEYHADRFIDYSVLCFRDQILVAICPAHKVGEELKSHWGLTYGGVLWGSDVSYIESLELADLFKKHLRDEGFKTLRIKGVPEFYLNEELKSRSADLYLDAIMNHSEFVYAIDYSQPLSIHRNHQRRKNNFRKSYRKYRYWRPHYDSGCGKKFLKCYTCD